MSVESVSEMVNVRQYYFSLPKSNTQDPGCTESHDPCDKPTPIPTVVEVTVAPSNDEYKFKSLKTSTEIVKSSQLSGLATVESVDVYLQPKIRQLKNEIESCYQKGEFCRCLLLLDKLQRFEGETEWGLLQKADCYMQFADFQSTILALKQLLHKEPRNLTYTKRLAYIYALHGISLFNLTLYHDALTAFSKAAELDPDIDAYQIRCLACLSALGRHTECLAMVNKRIEENSSNPDFFVTRARLNLIFNDTSLAYFDAKEALTLNSRHSGAKEVLKHLETKANQYKTQAVWLQLKNNNRQAVSKLKDAIDTNPEDPSFHVLRGAILKKEHDFTGAVDDFLLAMDKCSHDDDNPVYKSAEKQLLLTYNDFAVECYLSGFTDEALILLNKAIKTEKNEKGLYMNRGDCFYKQGNVKFAMEDFKQALELDPNDISIRARMAQIHLDQALIARDQRNSEQSEQEFSKAIQLNPLSAPSYYQRSRSRFMLMDVTGAQRDLLFCLHLDPTMDEAIGLALRLFPGKRIGEIMEAPLAQAVRNHLDKLLGVDQATEPKAEKHDQTKSDFKQISLSPGQVRPQNFLKLQSASSIRSYHQRLVEHKQQIERDVQTALNNTRNLHYRGPRMSSFPTQLTLDCHLSSRGGELTGKVKSGKIRLDPLPTEKKRSTGWKQYTKGLRL